MQNTINNKKRTGKLTDKSNFLN